MNTNIVHIDEVLEDKQSTLAYGHFSTIHPGHIRYLKHAKQLGGKLIIALIGKISENKKIFEYSQQERSEALILLSLGDLVVLLNTDELSTAIQKISPKILVLGNEFKESNEKSVNEAIKIQRSYRRQVIFHSGDIQYASTDLLVSTGEQILRRRREEFRNACKRNGLTKTKLINSINSWRSSNIVVIGDTIVDQYAACEAIGMSAEAPVVVVKELETKNFIGGAGIVASHIKALGADCHFISVVGKDEISKTVEFELNKRNIKNSLFKDRSRPTTFKKRYLVENQKLFRVSRLEEHNLDKNIEDQIIDEIEKLAPNADGIVISDFVYGVVTKRILEKIVNLSKTHNLLIFGDVQCSSQVGSIAKLKEFSLLCPNEREARIALQDKDSGLEELSRKLIEHTSVKNLIMKLGSKGFIAYQSINEKSQKNQPFPALCVNPIDVSGAGDALLAVMSVGMSSKQSVMISSAIACCVSCLAVENLGNQPIEKNALIDFIKDIL